MHRSGRRAVTYSRSGELIESVVCATSSTMGSIGIRELRQSASEYLRRVEAGEIFEVTDRGRPVAVLSPIAAAAPLDQLRAAGALEQAQGSMDDAPPPLEPEPGVESPSVRLARLRSDER